MSDEEIRIAIAEACGWVWYRMPQIPANERRHRCLFLPAIHEYEGQSPNWLVRADGTERICNMEYMAKEGHVPDYLNDLNAMHEAEKALTPQQAVRYRIRLSCNSGKRETPFGTAEAAMCHATARQRAEAFLRTIRKWKV